ncbi:MAG: 2-oxoacid:ferredoxin oxidoreductase subunit beta [Desulfitobacteriaceae bacterium]|nr:2-oxoacid:ferredoxin oxidoreductase subunit beta [Desulfitobacteriaceae bacterium]MDI6880589.1 2-oxoacid:ferredoxin oxidoreductase subunit beta [Desulfitobacteriaceae bacterium]MDI6914639.1 2-oxoacid:ferredoxin oxidoreductase subunit beta [Desulfitobacteriaceae bacterium]
MFSEIAQYFRTEALPHIWCPGCGIGTITAAIVRSIKTLQLDQNNVVIVSGIGCSSRMPGYLDFNTLHTTHGRALAFATGIKASRPELDVFVIMGDGDASAIGGNHFIHAARRNIDLTAIIINNSIYGMTGGQSSPMTPHDKRATTSPYGNLERPFQILDVAKAAGATYGARATAFHNQLLTKLIVNAYNNPGFSVVETISQCPVSYGRRNKFKTPADMLMWQKEHAVMIGQKEAVGEDFSIGEIFKSEAPEYTGEYAKLRQRLKGE